MPPKRRAVMDDLTGGSGDVNPQMMAVACIQSSADSTTVASIPTPVVRIPGVSGVTVMEVLKVYFETNELNPLENTLQHQVMWLTTNPSVPGSSADAHVLCWYNMDGRNLSLGVTTGNIAYFKQEPWIVDVSDGAGHGTLVAVDNISLIIASTATGIVNSGVAKILYRFKKVNLEEYVGIVQSQQ